MSIGMLAYLGTPEIAMIVGAVVLLFGGTKIPQLLKGMGQGIREFKSAASDEPQTLSATAPAKTAQTPAEDASATPAA